MSDKERPLGVWSLLALGINGIVGVGIFFAPKELAALAPGWTSIAVVAGTGLALAPVAIAVSTLGSRFDEDGGPVLYARRAFGNAAGFVVGWLAYVAALFSMGTVLSGFMGAILPAWVGPIGVRIAAVALLTILSLVAATGVRISAGVWSTLTVLKLLPLIALAIVAVVIRSPSSGTLLEPTGQTHWLRAALTATFVFQGFEIVPVLAGQARAHARTIPIAVLGSLAISTLIYIALLRGVVTWVPGLAHVGAPLVAMGTLAGGPRAATAISIGTSVSALGIAFGMVATTPRYLAALVPTSRFAKQRNGVPLLALLLTWGIVAVLVSLGSLGELLTLSSLSVVTQYLLVAVVLVKFSLKGELGLSPGRVWSAIPTALVSFALIYGASGKEWGVYLGCAIVGAIFYFAFFRSAKT